MATNNANNFSNPIGVANGGTGVATFTAYAPLCGGTTTTGALQQGTMGLSTSNNVLTSAGASALPKWLLQNAGIILLNTQTASNSASISFTSTFITSTYTSYIVVMNDISASATSSGNLLMTWSTNNGSTYLATNYQSGLPQFAYTGTTVLANTNSTTNCIVTAAHNGSTVSRSNGCMFINLPQSAKASYVGRTTYFNSGSSTIAAAIFGNNSGTTTINNIKFAFSVNNISTGTFSLYGIAQ